MRGSGRVEGKLPVGGANDVALSGMAGKPAQEWTPTFAGAGRLTGGVGGGRAVSFGLVRGVGSAEPSPERGDDRCRARSKGTTVGRQYKNPSIIEALCEFRFKPDMPWDATVFGRYYERVRKEYPEREELQDFEATIGQREGGEVVQGLRRSPRMRFYTEDRSRLLQVGERLLVVNVLPPYPHWDGFQRVIFKALEKWNEIVDSSPTLDQVTLRYIDRFEHKAEGFRLGDWIRCGPQGARSTVRASDLSDAAGGVGERSLLDWAEARSE